MNKQKIRFGIIGAGTRGIGSFGRMLCERTDRTELAALCDKNPYRMRKGAELLKLNNLHFYENAAEMIRQEQLDAVIITTPDCFHETYAVEALKCGMDILVDKPLSTTVAGCRSIIRAAEESGHILMMGFNLRHHPVLKRAKQLIDENAIGKIFLIENREFYCGGRTYMSRWNRLNKMSGGLWNHKGSHDFDVFQWLMDFPKPVKVVSFANVNILNADHLPFEIKDGIQPGPCCHNCRYVDLCPDAWKIKDLQNSAWSDEAAAFDGYHRDLCMYLSEKDTHDNGFAMVEYDNGARASHMECFVTSQTDRLYTIVGSSGQMEISLAERKIVVKPRWSQETATYVLPEDNSGHGGADTKLMDEFINVILHTTPNHASAVHGMYSTAVAQAAEISRREERLVRIEELFQ